MIVQIDAEYDILLMLIKVGLGSLVFFKLFLFTSNFNFSQLILSLRSE